MDIYTASYSYEGPDRLDITATKAIDYYGKMFAPQWDLVAKYKQGEVNEEMYNRLYRAWMNEKYRYHSAYMEGFARREGSTTFVCFCPPGAFCHRVIAAEGIEALGGVYRGERDFKHEPFNIYTTGDMLEIPKGILVHQVNCKGAMGVGLAKAIADRWPEVKKGHLNKCNELTKPLGEVQIVPINESLFVANVFGQDKYGEIGKRYTNYSALRKALNSLRKWRNSSTELFKETLPIFFPYRMSCGLAGGDWYLVFKMIQNIFPDAIIVKKEV